MSQLAARLVPARFIPLSRLAVLAACLATPTAAAGQAEEITFTGASVLDPGTSGVVTNATVIVRDGLIVSVEAGGEAPAGARVVDLGGRYLVPGLIDAHVHIGDLGSARRALMSGVTTARSMGAGFFADVGLRELFRSGAFAGPEILAAGYHVRPRPAEGLFLDEPALSDLLDRDVRGAEALGRVARAMLNRGVDFIKVNATERAGLPETDPRKPFFTEAELSGLVAEASGRGVPVAAHAHGDRGGRAAVAAGVRSIEHGTYLREETLRLMLERGTFLVPTIAVVSDLTLPGGDYDDPTLQVRGRHMLPRVRETAAAAHALGVPVVAATDTGYGPESVLRLSHELIELAGIGLSELDAIRAATTVAAELLGVGDRTGRVAEGFEADLLVLDRSPLEDIGQYQDVLLVMSDGVVALDRLDFRADEPGGRRVP
ncbi:amidohydrolase family protein [Candidatus Palauibacter sp.]|uniref:amidohydrolase family protein n=1 Tax=Candidatus Palauibacter sp. TaxID=3101350 RepID=UPI003AF2F2D9